MTRAAGSSRDSHAQGRLRLAHATLAVGLDDPSVYAFRHDQRRTLCARLGLAGEQADDLSRWVLAHPDQFDAGDLRCWRIGSHSWLRLADAQLHQGKLPGHAAEVITH
jgi:hypothetical protein